MQVLVALGGNLHNQGVAARDTLRVAVQDIESAGFSVLARSRFYRTPAFPAGAGPDYVNAALHLQAEDGQTPAVIYAALAKIELAHGRQRMQRWGGRTLDIDLLAMENLIAPDRATFLHWAHLPPALQAQKTPEQMIVPHPRLHERAFVLVPLMDIAPDWRHPVLGQTVRQMHDALPQADLGSVVLLQD